MKQFCLDTSAISNPLQTLPEDVHPTLWKRVATIIELGLIAVTTEIFEELQGSISGMIGDCINSNRSSMVLEITASDWDDASYVQHVQRMQVEHRIYIAEYSDGNPVKTICMNDVSNIALGKTLEVPVVSMETSSTTSTKHKRIPDICTLEKVEHLDFNELLRRAQIVI